MRDLKVVKVVLFSPLSPFRDWRRLLPRASPRRATRIRSPGPRRSAPSCRTAPASSSPASSASSSSASTPPGATASSRSSWTAIPIPETPANEMREGIARRQRLAAARVPLAARRAGPAPLPERPARRARADRLRHRLRAARDLDLPRRAPTARASRSSASSWSSSPPRSSPGSSGCPQRLQAGALHRRRWSTGWSSGRSCAARYQARRFDLQNCEEAKEVDEATGVQGLTGALASKGVSWVKPKDASGFLAPPRDAAALAAWARAAAATRDARTRRASWRSPRSSSASRSATSSG